jgi:electron transfer flavoprotein alpha subunit
MILVFAEHQKGQFKKAAFETVFYGHKTAEVLGTECAAIVIGEASGAEELGKYGANKVYQVNGVSQFDSQVYTSILAQAMEKLDANVLIMTHTSTGKSLIGRLSAKLDAASVSGVNSLPRSEGDTLHVRKPVFSGKAFADYELKSDRKVLSLMGNSFQPEEVGAAASVESLDADIPESRLTIKDVDRVEGVVPLPEAELVVSAGRGMKGPENWGIIEEMAGILGATTACSRPVADVGWRPHHEHVGQTGIAIRPNLYIAVGISGAIQHLAGVNNSKIIVAINKDPEAPFFKAADYGVVGDLFDVVPRLNDALRAHKS